MFWPEVKVTKDGDTLIATVDLPGVKRVDVRVEFYLGRLFISGERKRDVAQTRDNVYQHDRETRSFVRSIPLPSGITTHDIKARMEEGVLEVRVSLPVVGAPRASDVTRPEEARAFA